jgi:hypothetical protein
MNKILFDLIKVPRNIYINYIDPLKENKIIYKT